MEGSSRKLVKTVWCQKWCRFEQFWHHFVQFSLHVERGRLRQVRDGVLDPRDVAVVRVDVGAVGRRVPPRDEVRIWDRCRTQAQILNNMSRRFTKADIEPINQARFRWDMENLYQTNSEDDFPQKLLYLYNFDNLPDVAPAPTRVDALVFASDTDPVPAGWPQIAATRPIPYVPWWYVTKNRSTVYSTDYAYVPFIENVVSHMFWVPTGDCHWKPNRPPVQGLRPAPTLPACSPLM